MGFCRSLCILSRCSHSPARRSRRIAPPGPESIRPGDLTVIGISQWYAALGEYSFPTIFLPLDSEESAALTSESLEGPAPNRVIKRLQRAMNNLTGACFVGADVCAPTDSPRYRPGRWVSFGKTAWRLLAGSEKVKSAFLAGQTRTLTVRPFRRMDRSREFRLFIAERRVVAMSQYHIEEGFLPKIVARQEQLWKGAQTFGSHVARRLHEADVVVDVYLTASRHWLIVDVNDWGPPTDPLLFRDWEQDWAAIPGARFVPRPVKMKGNVSVSF